MKNIFKVTTLFCIIIACFAIPAFAFTPLSFEKFNYRPNPDRYYVYIGADNSDPVDETIYYFGVETQNQNIYFISKNSGNFNLSTSAKKLQSNNANITNISSLINIGGTDVLAYNDSIRYNTKSFGYNFGLSRITEGNTPVIYSTLDEALEDFYNTFVNSAPAITKNPNVDEFIANTLISMGIKFNNSSDAISCAADAWDYLIDEDNQLDLERNEYAWDIDYAVSYANAQSNNYKDWYNGYKVNDALTHALTAFINHNIVWSGSAFGQATLAGYPVTFYSSYKPLRKGSIDTPSSFTFYPASTITYFNGEYLYDNNVIDPLEFDYSPAQVRQFIGYPPAGTITIPSDPDAGTGTITDDPNNSNQKNISINFPALDWLADAIKSILDFLRDAFTTLANLLTQLLDAILGLFSDAFEGLTEFGEGFIEFLQTVFNGFSDVLSGFVPTDISTILVTFLALNIGLGLITFILKGH